MIFMVCLIQSPPFQPSHFTFHVGKYAGYPVNDSVEIFFQLGDIFIKTMAAHIVADIAFAYPVQSTFQKSCLLALPDTYALHF